MTGPRGVTRISDSLGGLLAEKLVVGRLLEVLARNVFVEVAEVVGGLFRSGALKNLDAVAVVIDEHGGAQSVSLKAVSQARIEEAVWKLPR